MKILRGRVLTFLAEPQGREDHASYRYIEDGAVDLLHPLDQDAVTDRHLEVLGDALGSQALGGPAALGRGGPQPGGERRLQGDGELDLLGHRRTCCARIGTAGLARSRRLGEADTTARLTPPHFSA